MWWNNPPSRVALAACLAILLQAHCVSAISKLSAVGSKFFNEEGKQFFVKGIAYQLIPKDPLVDTKQCNLDASLMKELGANAIRVYHVDPTKDHEGCMKAFADAGIYLFVDLDDFHTQIEPISPSWNETQFDAFSAILDEFQKFDNTAGVFVGNEVITKKTVSAAAPYILAAARDMKAYRDSKGYRKIPIGYSAADIAELRPMLQNYLVCRPEESERLDFFALNAYEWCGKSSFKESGYANLQKQAEGYPVPIFFSETGCNTVRPRDFMDLTAILGPEMRDTWSGAMVYEWIQEMNDYGLITYGKGDKSNPEHQDGFVRSGTPTPISPDFPNLKSRFATLSPSGVALSDYSKDASKTTVPPCPAPTAGGWEIDPSAKLPSINQVAGTAPKTTEPGDAKPTGSATSGGAASASSTVPNSGNQQISILASAGGKAFFYMATGLLAVGGTMGWAM
ncbi:hypothetical protein FQN55_009520 [Onygenales sp. PD_40]|nr:hypothetical protein FQN55_009520 [Onygenales sp. PD_40]KAK2790058.1 hypothetical protein FQN53_000714 [Emmonsiellopsis sp. PD_33]KAK2797712.1 hypothetical protein FQN51_008291 [Onygenales sp. PD_10]